MKSIIRKLYNNLRYMDKPLLIVSMILIIYGLFNIVTASSREAISIDAPLFYYFFKHGEMLLIGLFLGIIILNVDSKDYSKVTFLLYIVIAVCLFYLTFYGVSNRGAKNWLRIGSITFQPSEFAKPIIIVALALLYEKYYKAFRSKKTNHFSIFARVAFVGLFLAALIFLQKDFGTMLIILTIFTVMFFGGPILKQDKFKISVVAASLIGIIVIMSLCGFELLSEAQKERFDFFNPCTKYETSGYQICNGFIAINDGGILGLGIGKSRQKYSYIPEPHTDSVFAIIAEEYGLIFCFFIFFAYAFILYRILVISSKATTFRGKYICLGVATYIFAHVFINLGGLFGVIPLTGVPLPFLSYGGSFLVSAVCSLCLVQRINIETKKELKKLQKVQK